jgi:hypothetical protein
MEDQMRRLTTTLTLAFAAISLTTAPAAAQSVIAGVSMAKITFDPAENEPDLPGRHRLGWIAGLGFEAGATDRGIWQVELLVHQKGGRNLLRQNDAMRITYLEIPWLMHIDLWQSQRDSAFFVTVGPVASFALDASYEDDGVSEDILEDIARFDLGLALGVGLEKIGQVKIEGRIAWGYRQVFDDGDLEGKFKNRTAAVLLSWRLR